MNIMSAADRNYTDVRQSGIDAKAERVGDITGEPPTNEAMDRDKASKLANLLEGLKFPATKEEIRKHINERSPSMGNRINDVLEAIENNLDDRRQYGSAYDVEVAADLVKKAESERQNAQGGPEKIGGASSRDVSPNTPKGEDV
jgi:hypothetical protein